jgi:methylphosphotriester-DNA--protein-cysteine methyltransferase
MYIASKNYKIVCRDTCYHVKNIADKNRIEYETLNAAINDGCRRCRHCFGKDKNDQ